MHFRRKSKCMLMRLHFISCSTISLEFIGRCAQLPRWPQVLLIECGQLMTWSNQQILIQTETPPKTAGACASPRAEGARSCGCLRAREFRNDQAPARKFVQTAPPATHLRRRNSPQQSSRSTNRNRRLLIRRHCRDLNLAQFYRLAQLSRPPGVGRQRTSRRHVFEID